MSSSEAKSGELVLAINQDELDEEVPALERLRVRVLKLHIQCIGVGRQLVKSWILCGIALLEIKGKLEHGDFRPWVAANFEKSTGLSLRTAQRYMLAATRFLEFLERPQKSDLPLSELRRELKAPRFEHFFESFYGSVSRASKANPNDWESEQRVVNAVKALLGHIDCDPCSASHNDRNNFATVNYSEEDDGLDEANQWLGTAFIAPGHVGDLSQWYLKARSEMALGRLKEAVICLPESQVNLPAELFSAPVALTASPLTVVFRDRGDAVSRPLPTRSMFAYLSQKPNIEKFTEAFHDIGVVFVPARPTVPSLPATK